MGNIKFEWDENKNQINQRKHENLCIVSHCCRWEENSIRIISARKATKNEIRTYNKYVKGEGL